MPWANVSFVFGHSKQFKKQWYFWTINIFSDFDDTNFSLLKVCTNSCTSWIYERCPFLELFVILAVSIFKLFFSVIDVNWYPWFNVHFLVPSYWSFLLYWRLWRRSFSPFHQSFLEGGGTHEGSNLSIQKVASRWRCRIGGSEGFAGCAREEE